MNSFTWTIYWVGFLVGKFSGLMLGYIFWRLPARMNQPSRRERRRQQEEQDLRQWHENLLNTPMRSMDEIQADREPTWELPVVALGMQREQPAPLPVFKGPPIWRLRDWWTWSYGDIWRIWSKYSAQEQDRDGQRVVRTL